MGTILASAIISKAQTVLQDTGSTRWTTSELLGWLNEAQKAAVILKPEISVSNSTVVLAAGTRQEIPTGGIILLDIVRNMGVGGTTPGTIIRKILRSTLDEILPGWHATTTSATVNFACSERTNPKTYYVYPPQPSSGMGSIEIVYSVVPTAMAATTDTITIDDIYEGPLLDYCLSRAYSKDDIEMSTMYANRFVTTLAAKEQGETKQ